MSDAYTDFAPLKYDQAEINRQGWGTAAAGASYEDARAGTQRGDATPLGNHGKGRRSGAAAAGSGCGLRRTEP